ncbi:MAG: AMP-binding protein [Acidimicrobiales bacterium]
MNTVGELLAAACVRHRHRVAIAQGALELTYGALLDRSTRFARSLHALGVAPNERVAAFMTDGLESVEVFVGCALAGVTLVPVNARFLAGEATHVVHDSQATVLVYTTTLGAIAAQIDGLDQLRAVVAIGTGDRVAGAHAYESLLSEARGSADLELTGLRAVGLGAVSPEDIAVIGYTSGTTGFPKGARCSHRAVTTCTRLVPYVQGMVTNGAGTFIGSFSFVSALWGILYPHLWTGATLRLADPADPDSWIEHMARDGCTYTWVPSPLVRYFRDEMARRPEILTRLNTVVHTGSKVPREFLVSLVDVVGPRLVETWGLTESVGPLSATTRADFAASATAGDVFASVGRAVPTAQLALLGGDGTVRRAGAGELLARADTMFSGYLGGADDDPEAWVDGWFRTGDVGHIDDEGYVYIEDRSKDVIVSGGMNVYPAEVEMALATLPGVVECAVFAVSDDRWGETVAAAVVVTPDSGLGDGAIVDHVRSRLASYKKPTRVFFLDALPRNASMKVQKRALRDRFDRPGETSTAGGASQTSTAGGASQTSTAGGASQTSTAGGASQTGTAQDVSSANR